MWKAFLKYKNGAMYLMLLHVWEKTAWSISFTRLFAWHLNICESPRGRRSLASSSSTCATKLAQGQPAPGSEILPQKIKNHVWSNNAREQTSIVHCIYYM